MHYSIRCTLPKLLPPFVIDPSFEIYWYAIYINSQLYQYYNKISSGAIYRKIYNISSIT